MEPILNGSKKRTHPDRASPLHRQDESIVTLFDANSEQFSAANSDNCSFDETSLLQDQGSCTMSLLSVSEAGTILERHIADHPIETADDFHYIAELLRNYENDEDLKRVAELLRANKLKRDTARGPVTNITSLAGSPATVAAISEQDQQRLEKQSRKKKKDKKKKKQKKRKRSRRVEALPLDEYNDEYNDDSLSAGSSGSSSDSSGDSTNISSDSDSSMDDDDDDNSSTSTDSSSLSTHEEAKRRRKKLKQKEKKFRRKERERIRKDLERKEGRKLEKKARKKVKKEEKKRKKQEKAAMKRGKGQNGNDGVVISSNKLPPTTVEVVHATESFGKGNESTQSVSATTSDAGDWGGSREQRNNDALNSSSDDDSDEGPREVFQNEGDDNNSGSREVFVDEPGSPTVLAAINVSIAPEPPSGPALSHQRAANGETETESSGVLNPSLHSLGGLLAESVSTSSNETGTEFEDSFYQGDSSRSLGMGSGRLPSLPESSMLQMGQDNSHHNSPKRTSEVSLKMTTLVKDSNNLSSKDATSEVFNDSWSRQPNAAAAYSSNSVARSNKVSSRGSALPTIFSSVQSTTPPSISRESSKKGFDMFQEYELGLDHHTDVSSSEGTLDDEVVEDAIKRLSTTEEYRTPNASTPSRVDSQEYPPMAGNFHFARQASAQQSHLPSSQLNTSLILGRETSNPLLQTALQLTKSGTSTSTVSGSVFRPNSSRRMQSEVVSAREINELHENMGLEGQDLLVAGFNAFMVAAPGNYAEESGMQNPVQMSHDVMNSTAAEEAIQAEFNVRPRLLCLHGWRSNAEITRLQLDNLGLLDFFEPIFIEAPHISSKPADDAVNLLSEGPYYSWVDQVEKLSDADGSNSVHGNDAEVRPKSMRTMRRMRNSIVNIGRGGGQSFNRNRQTATGELMKSLKAVMVHLLGESQYLDALSRDNKEIDAMPCYDAVYGFSQGATLVALLSFDFVRNRVLEELNLPPMRRPPWNFVISACAANTNIHELLAQYFQFDFPEQIPLPSIHIIGLSDERKGQSESIMKTHYNAQQAFPIYLDSGHGIPAATKKLTFILDEIINWFLLKIALPDVDVANVPVEPGSKHASMLHIMDEIDKIQADKLNEDYPTQESDLDIGQLHLGKYAQYIINTVQSSHSNLIEMLESANPRQIAFLAPDSKPLTYGKFLKFIRGDGDLRRAGAAKGFTVAYVAPFGVVSATAFIAIASQCTAAPLDPASNESDYLLAFQQLKPDLVITFDGVDTGLIHKAAFGQGLRVSHATVTPGTCGLFQFEGQENRSAPKSGAHLDPDERLVNPADNNGLILRTSGTTSKPKVVPLKLWAIVGNSRVIAKNLGLKSTDIALNAMPLFHIGGLSANLMSSLAAGASVILLPKFNAAEFFDFLTSPEEPRPTWYSAVPTMHAAIHQFSEDSIFKTSLRFIRSGAASMPHDLALKMEKTFDCPMILTYSMTEQMPISQPPRGFSIPRRKPNSVGQPVCASMCIVDSKNLRPVLYSNPEEEQINGEVCISGAMIVESYVSNRAANTSSFFRMGGMDWFKTGDVGHLDKDGFLFLTGRSKELIKRGGDQVSPFEVEDAVYKHADVKTVVVFAVPDPIWGEKIGAAIILKDGIKHKQLEFKKEVNKMLLADGVQPFKLLEEVLLVTEDDLPKTRSNKYIRIGLAEKLGLNSKAAREELKGMRPVNYHEAAVGVKFFLAFAVLYVHIGNFDNRDLSEYEHDSGHDTGWEHSRSWCWHNPIFFLVGGFLLAAGTHMPITNLKDLGNFYSLRIAGLHPMYLLSILFCTINFVARCRPSNYITDFDRLREPLEGEYFVCQATPIEWSYAPTLIISIISYACTLQSWPMMMPFSWFLSYYTWFSSVYIFCIFVFPWCHQQYHAQRDSIIGIWKLNCFWLGMNYLYVAGIAVLFGMQDEALQNYFAISAYLFPPGWVPCCSLGIGCFYLFRHHRPNEKANAWVWGAITDALSFLLLAGWLFYGLAPAASNPTFASQDQLVKRHWDPFLSRILAPIGFLWFWGLAVGTGYTSKLFSLPVVVEWLAPASYNMFLFHQPIGEWYYLATRSHWWAYPKTFFWFSPYSFPVKFWEFFIVAGIVVAFSVFMEAYANEFLVSNFSTALSWVTGGGVQRKSKAGESVLEVLQSIITEITYADVERDTGLIEAGLSSMTTIILVSEIKKVYKTLKLTVRDVINSESVGDLVDVIEGRMQESAARPELALGKRTAVIAPKTLKNMMMMDDSTNFHEDDHYDGDDLMSAKSGHSRRNLMSFRVNSTNRISELTNIITSGSTHDLHQKPGGRSRRASFVLGGNNSNSNHSRSRRQPPHLPQTRRLTDSSDIGASSNRSLLGRTASAHSRREIGMSTISTSTMDLGKASAHSAHHDGGGGKARPSRKSKRFSTRYVQP